MKYLYTLIFTTLFSVVCSPIASAELIPDPTQFCQKTSDAIMRADTDSAVAIAMANEPDKSREQNMKAIMTTLVTNTKTYNSFGSMKIVEEIAEKRYGKSVNMSYFYYATPATDLFVRCEAHNSGAGWRFYSLTIESNPSKILLA